MAPNKITVNAYCPGTVGADMWELIDEKTGAYTGAKKGETLKAFIDTLLLAKEIGIQSRWLLTFPTLFLKIPF